MSALTLGSTSCNQCEGGLSWVTQVHFPRSSNYWKEKKKKKTCNHRNNLLRGSWCVDWTVRNWEIWQLLVGAVSQVVRLSTLLFNKLSELVHNVHTTERDVHKFWANRFPSTRQHTRSKQASKLSHPQQLIVNWSGTCWYKLKFHFTSTSKETSEKSEKRGRDRKGEKEAGKVGCFACFALIVCCFALIVGCFWMALLNLILFLMMMVVLCCFIEWIVASVVVVDVVYVVLDMFCVSPSPSTRSIVWPLKLAEPRSLSTWATGFCVRIKLLSTLLSASVGAWFWHARSSGGPLAQHFCES